MASCRHPIIWAHVPIFGQSLNLIRRMLEPVSQPKLAIGLAFYAVNEQKNHTVAYRKSFVIADTEIYTTDKHGYLVLNMHRLF